MVRRTLVLAALCCAAAACSKSPNNEPAPTTTTPDGFAYSDVDSLDIDGIVVIQQPSQQGGMAFTLLNPRAGVLAAAQWPLGTGLRTPKLVSASPDGEHIAWAESYDENIPTVRIARVFLHEDGRPDLEVIHEREMWVGDFHFFNAQGDRFISGHAWWDFDGDRIVECEDVDPARGVNTIAPSPDGRTYLRFCGDDNVIWHDFRRVGRPTYANQFTHDGEFLVHPLLEDVTHVFSRASASFDLGQPDHSAETPLPTGEFIRPIFARAGEDIVYRDRGSVRVPEIVDFGLPTGESSITASNDSHDMWTRGIVEAGTRTIQTADSVAVLALPDGASAKLMGLSPALDEAWFEIQVWTIEGRDNFDPTTGIFAPRKEPRFTRLLRVDLETNETVTNSFEPGSQFCGDSIPVSRSTTHLLEFARGESGWVYLDDDTAACRTQEWFSDWRGVRGEEGLEVLGNGAMASLSGNHLVGQEATDSSAQRICATPWTTDGWSCVDAQTMVSRTIGIVGWKVQRGDDEGTVPLLVSPTAAAPGREVVVRGYGFGDSGTLRIGDFEVPASDVSMWSDDEVRFRMPEGGPDKGRVTVDAGSGQRARKALWLYKTKRFDHRLQHMDNLEIEMRPGISLFDVPPELGLHEMEFSTGADHFFDENGKLVIVGKGETRFSVTDGDLVRWHYAEEGEDVLPTEPPWQFVPVSVTYPASPDVYPGAEQVLGRLLLTSGDAWSALVEYADGLPVDRLGFNLNPNYDTAQSGVKSRGSAAYNAAGDWVGWVRSLRAGRTLIRQTGWNEVLRLFNPITDYAQGNVIASFGDTFVRMGRHPTTNNGYYWRSEDGGNSWPTEQTIDDRGAEAVIGIGVDTPGGRYIVGVRRGMAGELTLFRFEIDTATLEVVWGEIPVEVSAPDSLRFYVNGTSVVAWSPMDEAAWLYDVEAAAGLATRVTLNGESRITAWYEDEARNRFIVASGDQLFTHDLPIGGVGWSPYATPFDIPIDMPVTIRALGEDVNGNLYVFPEELSSLRPDGLGYPGSPGLTGGFMLQAPR